jgi:hypothetical protein
VDVPEKLRGLLAAARRDGRQFDEVWRVALSEALRRAPERGDWRVALEATEAAWRACYNGADAVDGNSGLTELVA